MEYPKEIYFEPFCEACFDYGSPPLEWSEKDSFGPCKICGRKPLRFIHDGKNAGPATVKRCRVCWKYTKIDEFHECKGPFPTVGEDE